MIQIKGYDDVMKRLVNLQLGVMPVTEEATHRAMDTVQDLAMKALESKIGTGKWGGTWSHGKPVIHIGDAWEHTKGSWLGSTYMTNLSNNSDHAAAVEFGTVGPIRPSSASYLYLGDGVYKSWVRGQAGYLYLTEAINRIDDIKDVYIKAYRDFLRYSTM